MGSKSADGRTAALDELRQIFGDLNRVTDINDLKPIYYRLESLSQRYSSDSDVQSVLAEVRQRLIAKGQSLMEGGGAPPAPIVSPPPPPVATKPVQPPKAPPPTPTVPTPSLPTPPISPPPGPTPRKTAAAPPAAPPPASYDWKKTVILGAAIGMIVFLVGIAILRRGKTSEKKDPTPSTISVQIQTTPAGASIRVNNEPKCTSDCTLSLPPGEHQIQAFLDGYEPTVRTVNLTAGAPAPPVDIQLPPSAQPVRVNADVDQGKAKLDEDPPVDLVDGAATFDKVAPGKHTVKITGRGADATVTFEIAPGKAPVIDAAPVSKTHVAVVISNFQTSARLHSNKSDLKVAVDGQPAGQPGPSGLDLPNLQSGFREITFGEGEDSQKKLISIGPAPMLTTFIMRPAVTTGSLMVVTGEDAVSISINGKPYRSLTERGSRRIPNLPMGTYKVRVAKEGYQADPEKEVVIKKGEETKVDFQLRPVARLSAISLRGCPPGATISIDGNQIGTVGTDGNFSQGNVQPREHVVELRRDNLYRRLPKQFTAGATVEIRPPECSLEPVPGTLRINVAPSDARISYRRSEEAAGQARPIPSAEFQTLPGSYVITATAPNHNQGTRTVTVTSGATQIVDIALVPVKGTVTPTPPPISRGPYGMESWENPVAWTNEGSWSDARGGDFVLYKIVPTFGTFDFNVRLVRGRQIKWVLNFIDARNHCMFLLDDNGKLTRRVIVDGRRPAQDVDIQHNLRTKEFTVRIEVVPSGIRHSLLYGGNTWRVVDTWNLPISPAGKFGVYLPSRDQIGFANFKFTPR